MLASFFPLGAKSPLSVEVECTTVDEYLGGQSVDVVKIDIEGAETLALRGMRSTLENSPLVKLFVELEPERARSAGSSPDALVDELQDLGFDVFVIDEGSRRLILVERSRDVEELISPLSYFQTGHYVNLYCIKGASGSG